MAIKQVLGQYGASFQQVLFNHNNKIPTDLFRDLIKCKLHQVATMDLLKCLKRSHPSTVSLIQLLSPINDIDILLEQTDNNTFIDSVDRFLHDTPFKPFYYPQVDPNYMPHEIYIRRKHIWHSIFWLYSQRQSQSTCNKCLEKPSHMLLHWLFECDKQSDSRTFLFDQLTKLKQSEPTLSTHPLFQLINEWYDNHNHQQHDIDFIDIILRSFMAPLATSADCNISIYHATIIRSLFITMCALAIPHIRKLLHPLHWFQVQPSVTVDLEDSSKNKSVALRQYTSGNIALCDISTFPIRKNLNTTDFPVFGSAQLRKKNPTLQASATSFINNILRKYPNDYFLWSDAAFKRTKSHSAAATLITHNNNICHTSSVTLNTNNIATAEIAGIMLNLTWLLQYPTLIPSVHIMCDNQYAVKACLKLCNPHPNHIHFYSLIHRTIKHLSAVTKIFFHWIPGHTNNKFHSQVDHLACNCLYHSNTFTLTLSQLLKNHTDAMASGRVNHP